MVESLEVERLSMMADRLKGNTVHGGYDRKGQRSKMNGLVQY